MSLPRIGVDVEEEEEEEEEERKGDEGDAECSMPAFCLCKSNVLCASAEVDSRLSRRNLTDP